IGHLGTHSETESRIGGRLASQKAQEVPLGHEGDELAARREMTEVGDRERPITAHRLEFVEFLVWKGEKIVEETQVVHDLQSGGVQGVATEVAEEVAVFFEHGDLHSSTGQQEAEHHARRTATSDAATRHEL